jgi:hypothetical protein
MITLDRAFQRLNNQLTLRQRSGDRNAELEGHRTLRRGQTFAVGRPLGMAIECLHGTLWITHDGDPKDIVLVHGQRHTATRASTMLIHALDDSSLRSIVALSFPATTQDAGLEEWAQS